MTLDQFIELLEKHAGEAAPWHITPLGVIFCGRETSLMHWMLSEHKLTMSAWDYNDVWKATLNSEGHDPALRSRLLRAVGLQKGD